MTVYTDNFNTGAASTDLSSRGTNSGGFTWAKTGGTNVIRSTTGANGAITNAGTTAQTSGYTVPAGIGAAQYAKSVKALDTTAQGVAVRIGNSGSGARGYVVRHSAAATVIYRVDPGGTVTVLQNTSVTGNAADTLGLEANGSSIRATRNGSYVAAAVTDATYATGSPGMIHASTASAITFDDFEGGDLGGGVSFKSAWAIGSNVILGGGQ